MISKTIGISYYIIQSLIFAMMVLSHACSDNSGQGSKTLPTRSDTSKATDAWPHNHTSKKFKIDSSEFEVTASIKYLTIRLEPTKSFESQLNKIKQALPIISNEMDISQLKQIGIQPINHELLANIAAVPEIQQELKQPVSEFGYVNSMGIVSPNAHKAKQLKEISDLFGQYDLESHKSYIDKCRVEKLENDTNKLSMRCATIHFELRTMERK